MATKRKAGPIKLERENWAVECLKKKHDDCSFKVTMTLIDDTKAVTKESQDKIQSIMDKMGSEIASVVELEPNSFMYSCQGSFEDSTYRAYPLMDLGLICYPVVNLSDEAKEKLMQVLLEARDKAVAIVDAETH